MTETQWSELYAYIARSLFLITLGGTLLVLAIRRLRQFKLKERYALLFVLIALPFIALSFWQEALVYLAGLMDVQVPTFALICVSVFLCMAIFELLTIVSVQDRKITTLAQMVGMLMERQDDTNRRQEDQVTTATGSGITINRQ